MIPELGHIALILALSFAILQSIVPFVGISQQNELLLSKTKLLTIGNCFFCIIAYVILTYSFVVNDFSVAYVAQNSSKQLPLMFRATAVWGAHEGSMLLWVLLLCLWSLVVISYSKRVSQDLTQSILGIMGFIHVGFLLFMLSVSNPFLRLVPNMPMNGNDLNPLLQDIGFLIHPPILYIGYVGFAVVFAFAIAVLIKGQMKRADVKWLRSIALIAFAFLTAGINMGSWWAYRELGWGGWWFWDPVENASFLPWLTSCALIHSLAVSEKRGLLNSWSVLLCILSFILSLLGTFLVRSGVITSVHSFTSDPSRGVFILGFLAAVITFSIVLYMTRQHKLYQSMNVAPFARESVLLINNMWFVVGMCIVLLGTLYPMIYEALSLGQISVGAPYYNGVFVPLMLPLIFLLGFAPQTTWGEGNKSALLKAALVPFGFSVLASVVILSFMSSKLLSITTISVFLAIWVLSSNLAHYFRKKQGSSKVKKPLSILGMTCAHVGVGVFIIGVAISSASSVTKTVKMTVGETETIGAYQLKLISSDEYIGPNYKSHHLLFDLSKNQKLIEQIDAEKRVYELSQMPMTEAAIYTNVFEDVYIALGDTFSDGTWTLSIMHKPFIRFIWLGGFLIVIGGLLSAFDRRYKKEAQYAHD